MSIVDEITRIKNNIANAYAKLEEKGATLPTDKNSSNLSSTIESLVVGGSSSVANDIISGTLTEVNNETLSQVESIRSNAFSGMDIEKVSVPSNVISVGDSAFANNSITSLTINNGVESIGNGAFQNNSITEVNIPASVTSIGDSAFAGNNLTEITMESDTPPIVTSTTFPDTLQTTNVSYNGYPNYVSDENWATYQDTLIRGLAIPSTITVVVNNSLDELVSGAIVTIEGNGQVYTGITDSVGVFVQGNLQPATYTVSVADLDGFDTPETQEIVVKENTQNTVTMTYSESSGLDFSTVLSENSPATISAISDIISANNMTSAEVEATYGWKVGDTIPITLTTGENIEVRINGYNHDTLSSDHTTKAGISWGMTYCLATKYIMNSANTNAGGWASCEFRKNTIPTIFDTLPQEWKNIIKLVDKKSANGGVPNYTKTITTSDSLFLLSEIEVFGTVTYAQDGANEGVAYEYWNGKVATDRIKKYDKDIDGVPETSTTWWLRSCYEAYRFCTVSSSGTSSVLYPDYTQGISVGFCT